ncbi:bifunctional diaminohydroxyphosphoribosylaminopyrimidine deaminase/5-amino-6-(5-phosphoribosylamino)uracil reductase RibD [Myroides sp. NP-2]|uniref:bifunctional diaminohydroxyphosphoribosylaminopyrimidine deaminase/5-amino-6-(5-phosphoribosylamino)uracil reductase RibD n=1 Tax=Myroides sp. NP-2 TaxID=2759945 RepID=UPI0015FBAA6A|nr:bifunctional diaminohydroxyphosphoribosylaminopyrimidine deaminase/5-amino-6-(5-phosphoribosylamino)uracil reductase RibD [Myroides sp. NP-2]MBB1150480.1 bifunctional diaminohydroxyphosphoribosylaminopyrimidine deaminase/5-amino-6-(5-phosphoribosylamino)uracil reductase RibD [Myroides sp. NP-2]
MFKDTVLSMLKKDEYYISRCLQLAKQGTFAALPNPSVGAVVVHNDRILGEGFTSAYGGPHAEVNAIAAVKDANLLKESTLYVSLEPCSHVGKTPPCCDLVIAKKIPRVVVGTIDPFAQVCGMGIQKMKEAGIEVVVGVLEEACRASNQRFFTYHQKKRPYIILKWAESQDGFIAPLDREEQAPVWLSNAYAKQLVHQWRSEEMAFLVGTNTVLADNPSLTTRSWYGKNPTRVYLDRLGKISSSFAINQQEKPAICITANRNMQSTAQTQYYYADFDANVVQQICTILYDLQIMSVVIEGGTQTIQHFIAANLWDEARIFTSEVRLGEGILAPEWPIAETWERYTIANNELHILHAK